MKKFVASLLASIFVITSTGQSVFAIDNSPASPVNSESSMSEKIKELKSAQKIERLGITSAIKNKGPGGSVKKSESRGFNKDKEIKKDNGPDFVPGELIIKFKSDKINMKKSADDTKVDTFAKSKKLKRKEKIKQSNMEIMETASGETVEAAVTRIKTDDSVEYVQPNYIYHSMTTTPNDADFSKLWGLNNVGQQVNGTYGTTGKDIKWLEAMNIFQGTQSQSVTGTIVAVIDSGVSYNHPDLINQMWDGSNCKDENGNYLGGCFHGYDYEDGDKNPLPTSDSHGTHIAGTIAAQMNNIIGIAGVNPNGKIMAIKSGLTTVQNVKAINFAKQNGAKIINASWGSGGPSCSAMYDASLYDAIKNFPGLFITAAGNSSANHNGTTYFDRPSDYGHTTSCWTGLNNLISVAATDQNDNLTSFSDYGANFVDIGAPGKNIYSTEGYRVFDEDFQNVSTPSIGSKFTQIQGNSWGTKSLGGSKVLFTDYAYTSNYRNNISSEIDSSTINLSGKTNSYLNFNYECDAENGYDFLALGLWNGTSWVIQSAYTGQDYGIAEIPLKDFASNNFKFGYLWQTDNSNDASYMGCIIYDIKIVDGASSQGSYQFMDGTSMAAPHVAGLASLAWSYRPDLSNTDIKKAILDNGDSTSSLVGRMVSGKRINALNTLRALTSPKIANLKVYTDSSKTKTLVDGAWSKSVTPTIEWEDFTGQTLSSYDINVDYSSGYTNTPNPAIPSGNFYSGSTVSKSINTAIMNNNGEYKIYIRGINSSGTKGDWISTKVKIDNLGPAAPVLTSPINNKRLGVGTTTLLWNAAADAGVGMLSGSYLYQVSPSDNIFTELFTGSISNTNVTIPALGDGTYIWWVVPVDGLGNTGAVSSTGSFIKDTVPPNTPTNIHLNNDVSIDVTTVNNVTLVGSGQIADAGVYVRYTITNTTSITGTGILDAFGAFNIPDINVSSLPDGNLNIAVKFIDDLGNESAVATAQVYKDAIAPTGTITFLSGAYINSTGATLHLTSSEPVIYTLSGADIVGASTGSLVSASDIPVTLTDGDGTKTLTVQFSDVGGNTSPIYSVSITLDTIAPEITISSHTDNEKITGQYTTLTGATTDENGISSVKINSEEASGKTSWSKYLTLVGGDNTINVQAKDVAGNIANKSLNIIRITDKPKTFAHITGMSSAQVLFTTDIPSYGVVRYGTDSANLTETATGIQLDTNHTINLTNLSQGTRYFYTVYGINGGYNGISSEQNTFYTPITVESSSLTNTGTFAGPIFINGSTGTGISLNGAGTIEVHSSDGSGMISIPTNTLDIVSPSGTWDGIIEPPTLTQASGSFLLSGYSRLMELTYKIGSLNSPLNFSGGLVKVTLPVGDIYNGKNLKIHRSDDNQASFIYVDECLVANGLCTFQTNGFSVFSALDPTDDVPDAFNFSPQSGIEINSPVLSDLVTITGLNISTGATVTGGTLVINGVDVGTNTVINNNTMVSVKIISPSTYSTSKSAIVTIGGVSSTFVATTKSTPSAPAYVSSGGGGSGNSFKDKCPNGDNSPSYYDNSCVAVIQSGSTSTSPEGSTTHGMTINDLKFKDINGHWSYAYVARLALRGIVKNSENFNPEKPTTRAEFIKMVVFSGLGHTPNNTNTIPFEDVDGSSWMYPYIAYAFQKGMIRESKQFRPNDYISRQEAIKILILSLDSGINNPESLSFADVEGSSEFKGYIEAARSQRIISGQEIAGKRYFKPLDYVSRAEIAKIIAKAFRS